MFRLSLRALRARPGSFAASFLALLIGGAVVLACGGLLETGIRTAVPADRLAGAAVVVTGDQDNPGESEPLAERVRLDPSIVDILGGLPGVVAVPDVSVPATIDGTPVVGHGWGSLGLGSAELVGGRAPSADDEVVLDAALGDRDRVRMAVRGEPAEFRVVGTVRADGASAYFTDAAAIRMLDGRVDAVALVGDGDPEAISAAAENALAGHRAVALTGDDRGLAEVFDAHGASARIIPVAAVFGGVALMVAGFVVASTLSLAIRQRDREMALLRAVGATPGQLRRMIIGETLVVAVLAGAAAWPPGDALGGWLLDRLVDAGVAVPEIEFRAGWLPAVVAAGSILLAAVAAAAVAARAATRARPTDALAESALPRRWLSPARLVIAVLALAGALALAIVTATVMSGPVAASTAGPSALLWAGGLALLAPGLTRVLLAVLGGPLRAVTGAPGRLAVLNARARRVRVAAAVAPVMLATGLATALIYLQVTQAEVAERLFAGSLRADAVVTAPGGLAPDAVAEIASAPGVTAASALVTSHGHLVESDEGEEEGEEDTTALALRGVTPAAAAEVTADTLTSGSFTALGGDTVILPDTLDRAVGEEIRLRLGDGEEVTARVVGTVAATPGFESAYVAADLLLPHTTTGLVPQVLVRGDPAALAGPDRVVADRAQVLARAGDNTGALVNHLLVAIIVGYAVVALVNTLIVATTERRREFATQRLVGATRGQVLRMVTAEASLVAVSGIALGTAVAALTLGPFGIALTGDPAPSGPLWIYLAIVGGAAALTALATLLPAAAVLRKAPTAQP
ncbi:ABC transporter permease [Actinokineospora sp. UTMC 2448]|uniref:ABC transporter permease n=1 Tax=Actinokineospora sp. UTMC 2448 TaxID=2268449 RepID=UPI002164317F|nr:ABC transporter permease [Actinokineospora sp. UTMC 2448]UVS80796.1 acidobacterial duplicated orphan permease [Actinokineospora sp. UTMC 2448]